MMGGRPPLSAPSSGVTNRFNPRGLVGGRGGDQVRPSASSLSLGWKRGGREGLKTAAKGDLEKGEKQEGVEDLLPGKGERSEGLSPTTLENSTVSTRVEFR